MKPILMSVDTVYQEDLAKLLKLNPYAAMHDGKHYLFIKQLPESERSYTTIDVDAWEETGDEQAWKIAAIITVDDDAVPEADIYTFDALHKHAAWRIWCAKYENREQFKADWQYIKEMVTRMNPEAAALWPEYNEQMSYEDGREIIFTAIAQFISQ